MLNGQKAHAPARQRQEKELPNALWEWGLMHTFLWPKLDLATQPWKNLEANAAFSALRRTSKQPAAASTRQQLIKPGWLVLMVQS